ncbi:acyltransferase family protein [Pseudopedobacter sp.]|uniref:acyltransferase family protein n=1 Tax=Pseudopedobacter sp. TaxID=1936787 RepID=UPI00333F9754
MQYRNDIQGLRALAVMFVFFFHLSSSILPGGFIGVDMFFVISGYLITKISLNKVQKGSFKIIDFYLARVKRIIPSYYFLLLVIWLLFLFVYAPSDVGKFKFAHFWSFLFSSNTYFATLDDYFGASSSENPFLHTWTLSIEMQFYLILPILLIIFKKLKHLLVVIGILLLTFIIYSSFEILSGNKAEMYFSLIARSPEFFIGVLAAGIKFEEKTFFKENSLLFSIIGLVGLLVSLAALNESSNFPGIWSLLPCVSTLLILISPTSKVNKFLSNRILFFIGEISYSIYLWHWPLMAFYRYSTERYEFTLTETLLLTAFTIFGSLFSYYLIEKPFRKIPNRKLFLPIGALMSINFLMIYFTVPIKRKFTNIPKEYIYPIYGIDSHGKDFKQVGMLGDSTYKKKRILFLGDSHALTFKPYLDKLGKEYSLAFRTITNDGYPAIPHLGSEYITEKYKLLIYEQLLPHIRAEVELSDVIIIHFARSGNKWIVPLSKMFSSLRNNQKVLVLSDYPVLDKNPVRVNKSFLKNGDKNNNYKMTKNITNSDILKLIENNSNIRFVNFSEYDDFFEDAPFYQDTLMYYDASHLNYYGAKKYADYTGKFFIENLNWALNQKE